MLQITELARQFGLSRSTLLYYDRIGLLSPSGRSESGYRLYSDSDRERLSSICGLRQAGLTIDDIRIILTTEEDHVGNVLQRRLKELGEEMRELQAQQHLLAGMLKTRISGEAPAAVDRRTWVEMLRAAGMDDDGMNRWHAEFERRAPEAHHAFLLSIGIDEKEALLIRKYSASFGSNDKMEAFP